MPKKKRIKVEKSGKSKLPSAETSDAWYKLQLEKENIKKVKEEKQKNKKNYKKRKLIKQVKEIQKKLKRRSSLT